MELIFLTYSYINSLSVAVLASIHLLLSTGDVSASSSNFNVTKTAGSINPAIVKYTFNGTSSVIQCCLRCADLETLSTYFVAETSTCYCNTRYDTDVQGVHTASHLAYGARIAVNGVDMAKPGNGSICQKMYDIGHRYDGLYTLPEGRFICNMTELGWIVFQRRIDGSVDFYRNWTEYVNGFGNVDGEFWLGLASLHNMTKSGCELHIYLEAVPGNTIQLKGYAKYDSFIVDSAMANYSLHVSGFSGTVGDTLVEHYHNGREFSTYDADNDIELSRNCAEFYTGGWWYSSCLGVCLNGVHPKHEANKPAQCIVWYDPWKFNCVLTRVEMAIRC